MCNSRAALLLVALSITMGSQQGLAQTAALAVASATQYAGQSVSLNLQYSGAGVSGVQWDLLYSPADFNSVQVVGGPAAANKSVICGPNPGGIRCIVVGMNSLDIPNGVIATVNADIAPATANSPPTYSGPIGVLDPIATSGSGVAVPITASGGTVTIVRPAPTAVTPASVSMYASQVQQFAADIPVNWSRSPAVGSITSAGLYRAPSLVPSAQQVTVIARNPNDSSLTATATVSLYPVTVSVTPGSVNLAPSQTRQFVAAVTDSPNSSVTWKIAPQVGSISSNGLYTAPAVVTTQQAVVVTATSVFDSTKSDSAVVTVIGSCNSPANLVLTNQTITGSQILEGTSTATLGPNLIVNGTYIVVNAPILTILGGTTIRGTFSAGNHPSCH